MKLIARLFLVLAALMATPVYADPADISAASRSVVRVVLVQQNDERYELIGHGSGFAVGPDLIVTNAHVVAQLAENDNLRIGIVPSQGKSGWFAQVVQYSPRNDLALLRLTERATLPQVTLYPGPVEDGSDVFAVGYPGNVDLAQGLGLADLVTPTAPVKTRGSVSGGRSSKQFDTILHTAPIGSGNSGGPLLDACGRVIGVNSFGTQSEGADSEFYFAVSMREVMKFLHDAGVTVRTANLACRSMADLDQAENAREQGAAALAESERRALEEAKASATAAELRRDEHATILARENHIGLAFLLLLAATVLAAAALYLREYAEDERRWRKFAGIGGALALGALVVWFTRPAFNDPQPAAAPASEEPVAKPSPIGAGAMTCVLVPERSRVTVSEITDVALQWGEDGCVNGRTQYGQSQGAWSRILVPNSEDTVSVASYDPKTKTYRTERFLLDLDTMAKARAVRAKYTPPSCGAGPEGASKLGLDQESIKALLPAQPNERLVYKCEGS